MARVSRTESARLGRRRLLDDLLVATLGRTVPVTEDHYFSGAVAEDLDLDVAGAGDETFEEHRIGSEARPPRPLDRLESIRERAGVGAHPHADSTATGHRFEHHRVTDALRRGQRRVYVGQHIGTRCQRNPSRVGRVASRGLVTEQTNLLGRRTEEDQARGFDRGRELGVLTQEPVAGVNGVGTPFESRGDHGVRTQIALQRRAGTDVDAVVRQSDVGRVGVRRRVDRHTRQAHAMNRRQNSHRDLAAVRDKNLRDPRHGRLRLP